MTYCVGLTGSIASGKSTILDVFGSLGAEIISADQVARQLTKLNTPAYQEIVEHFGPQSMLQDGNLDRSYLRQVIFTNPDERLWLEGLLHPMIRKDIKQLVNQTNKSYCVIEIPLLFDTTHYPYLNQVLVITAPKDLQISRVTMRDNSTKEEALAIIGVQPQLDKLLKFANDVLVNDMTLEELKQAILGLHNKYLNEAKRKKFES